MDIAKNLLSNMLDSRGQEFVEVGLRVYGHQFPVPPQECRDTRFGSWFWHEQKLIKFKQD